MRVEGVGTLLPVTPVIRNSQGGEISAESVVMQDKPGEFDKGEQKGISRESIEESVALLNKTMESYSTEIRFSIHEASGEYQVRIVNTQDDTVIKELPPESVLNMVAYFKQLLGIVVDKFI